MKPIMRGEITLFRFCDDFIICFQYQDDAEKVYRVLPKRFERFGLALHTDKTKLIEFGRFAELHARRRGEKTPVFKFLGFVFYCGKALKSGKYRVKLKTVTKRLGRKLNEIRAWCRKYRHLPVWQQRAYLSQVMRGYFNYYGRRDNFECLKQFSRGVIRTWKYWLGRRGQKEYWGWKQFNPILRKYPLPKPTITQNWQRKQAMLF